MNSFNKKIRKNKYNIIVFIIIFIIFCIFAFTIKSKLDDVYMSKYDSNIVIIKGGGDEIKSYSIKDLKKLGVDKTDVFVNNGLEKVKVEGISLERLIGNLDYNLREKPIISIEDVDGNSTRYPMSVALEVNRVYLVYRIEGQPILEYNPSYGNLAIVDTNSKSANTWLTNVKTLDIH